MYGTNGTDKFAATLPQGYASLKQGNMGKAVTLRDTILDFAAKTEARFRFHPADRLIGTLAHILEGEILWAKHDLAGAIIAFRKAAEVEDLLDYDEPEPLPFAARHWLGAAFLESEQYVEAETAYRDELNAHPHNGWSLCGLKAALAAQGKTDDAVNRDFEESWARADTWITASKF